MYERTKSRNFGMRLKNWLRTSLHLCLCLALLMQNIPLYAMGATEQRTDYLSDDNGYIKYVLDASGGFAVLPSEVPFDPSKPLSRAFFLIDGEEYIFGNYYPEQMDQQLSVPQQNADGTSFLHWQLGDYAITQVLNIVTDDAAAQSYGVYIGYEIAKNGVPANLSARIVLDTQLGCNDDQPAVIPELGGFIAYEESFTPAPSQWLMERALSLEEPLAFAFFADTRFLAPTSLSFGHFRNLISEAFSFNPDPSQRFNSTDNLWGYADSAIAVDYRLENLSASAQTIGFIYGFTQVEDDPEPLQELKDLPILQTSQPDQPDQANQSNQLGQPSQANEPDQVTLPQWLAMPTLTAAAQPRSVLLGDPLPSNITPPQVGDPHDGVDFSSGANGLLSQNARVYYGATDHSFGLLMANVLGYVYPDNDSRVDHTNGRYETGPDHYDDIQKMWSNSEGLVKPILWRIMGEDKKPTSLPTDGSDPSAYESDGYITMMSEYVLHGTPVQATYEDPKGWEADFEPADFAKSKFYSYLKDTFESNLSAAENAAIPSFPVALERYVLGKPERFAYDPETHDENLVDDLNFPRYLSGQKFYAPWGYLVLDMADEEITAIKNAFVSWSAANDPIDEGYTLISDFVLDEKFHEVIEGTPEYDFFFTDNMVGSRRFPGIPSSYPLSTSYWAYQVSTFYPKDNFVPGIVSESGIQIPITLFGFAVQSYLNTLTRPLTKLNPEKIILAEEITAEMQAENQITGEKNWWYDDFSDYLSPELIQDNPSASIAAVDDFYYRAGEGDSKHYRLTVLGENDGAEVGTLSLPETTTEDPFILDLNESSQLLLEDLDVSVSSLSIWDNSLDPTPTITLNYKIVTEQGGKRQIVAFGSGEPGDSLSIDCSSLSVATDYDVYLWIQKNYQLYSNVASMPQHFSLKLEQNEYTINHSALGDASFELTTAAEPNTSLPSGIKVAPNTPMLLKDVHIPYPEKNLLIWQAFYLQNGEQVALQLTKNSDDTYRFSMPTSNVELHLQYYPKESIWIKTQPSTDVSFTLKQLVGLPGDTIEFNVASLNPALYIEKVEVSYPNASSATYLDVQPGTTLSFVIPQEITSGNILLQAVTKPMPNITTEVHLAGFSEDHTLSLIDIGTLFGGNWIYDEDNQKWVSTDYKPNQSVRLQISSDKPYWRFDITGMSFNNATWNFSPSSTSISGVFKSTLRFTTPDNFTYLAADAQNNHLIIRLEPKQIYRSYQVSNATPNAASLANLEKITVSGQFLEQIVGGGDYTLLNAEEQAVTKTVKLSLSASGADSYEIAPQNINCNETGTQLTIAIDPAIKSDLQDILSDSEEKVFLYLTIGKVQKKIQLETNYMLRHEPFGILGVVADSQNHHRIVLADSEAELQRRMGSDRLAFKIRGNITYPGSLSKAKTFNINHGTAIFDDILRYEVGGISPLKITELNGKVSLNGGGGKISLPGIVLGDVETITIEMNSGMHYDNSDYFDDNYRHNVVMKWSVSQNTKTTISSFLGFQANFTSLRFVQDRIFFGGTLNVGVLMDDFYQLANINIEKLSYKLNESGQYVYEGVVANGRADIFGNMTLGNFIDFSNNITANIDTFTGDYQFDAEINVVLFSFEASVDLTTVNNKLVPDALSFHIEADPGIRIIPPVPIAKLKGGGGGIKDLANVIGRQFNYVPQLKIGVSTTIELLEFLSMKTTYYFGPSGVEFSGNPQIGFGKFKIAPFSKFEGQLQLSDQELFLRAAIELVLVEGFEVIIGGGNFYIGYSFVNRQFNFSGVLYSKLQIPPFQFLGKTVGPFVLFNQELGISNTGVYGKARVIGIPIEVGYRWGASLPYTNVFSLPVGNSNEIPLYDAAGNALGELTVGGNIKLVASSGVSGTGGSVPFVALTGTEDDQGISFLIQNTNEFLLTTIPMQDLVVKDSQNEIVALKYARDGLMGADPYREEELNASGINAVCFPESESMGEAGLETTPSTIMLRLPLGTYTIFGHAGSTYNTELFEATPLPELTELALTTNDDALQVAWAAAYLQANKVYKLDLFITPSSNAEDREQLTYPLRTDIAIDNISGDLATNSISIALVDLPKNLSSGEYYLRGYLKEITDSYSVEEDADKIDKIAESRTHATLVSDNSFTHINLLQPPAVTDLTVTYGGNGNFSTSWSNVMENEKVYYLIEALDEQQQPVLAQQTLPEAEGSAESLQPVRYIVSPDMAQNGSFNDILLGGLTPGKEYHLRITPYVHTAENGSELVGHSMALFGTAQTSTKTLLTVPKYPVFENSFEGALLTADLQGNISVFSNGSYILNIKTDTPCDLALLIDNREFGRGTTVANEAYRVALTQQILPAEAIEIIATNADGDQSYYTYLAYVDDTPPDLYIETTEGVVPANSAGAFTLQGSTKPFASVSYLANDPVTVQSDRYGRFSLSGQALLDPLSGEALITLSAFDAIGNYADANILLRQVPEYSKEITAVLAFPATAQLLKIGDILHIGIDVTDDQGQSERIFGSQLSYALHGDTQAVVLDPATGYLKALAEGDVTVTVQIADSSGQIHTAERIDIHVQEDIFMSVSFNNNGGDSEAYPQLMSVNEYGKALGSLPTAPTRSGYRFTGWNTAADGSGSVFNATTPLTANLIVFAQWERLSGSPVFYSGGTTSAAPATTTLPSIFLGGVQILYTIADDTVSLLLSAEKIAAIIASAVENEVLFDLSDLEGIVAVSLSKTALTALAEAGLSLSFQLPQGTLTLNMAAAVSLAAQAAGQNLRLSIEMINPEALSEVQRQALKEGDIVYDICITSLDTPLSSFDDGELTLNLPYTGTLPAGIWFLSPDGTTEEISFRYADGRIAAQLPHLSLYVVGQRLAQEAKQTESKDTPQPVEPTTTAWQNPFSDVHESDWFYANVAYVVEQGWLVGTESTLFSPQLPMTRAMLTAVLWRLAGNPETPEGQLFSDVDEAAWYAKAVNWAASSGIAFGYGNDLFGPEDSITREQLAALLCRYTELTGNALASESAATLFSDDAAISSWAKEAVYAMQQAEVIFGKPGNLFDPQGLATRAEVAAIIQRYLITD